MRSLLGRFHRPMSRGLVNNMLTMNNLGDGSTLSLDFTTMGGVLDPRLTFSRASTATFVNSSGYVEYAGANLMEQSNSFTTLPWVSTNVTMSQFGASPVGAAWKMLENSAAGSVHRMDPNSVPCTNNGVFTFSTYVKQGSGSRQVYFLVSDNATGEVKSKRINPVDGTLLGTETIGGSWSSATTTSESVGDGWYRLKLSVTKGGGTSVIWRLGMSDSSGNLGYNGDGSSFVCIAGCQINPGSTAQTYYPTTTAAYHAPRFDYSPTNIGEPRGLLIEAAATNLFSYSEDFSHGSWLKSNATASTNATTAPDGNSTADYMLETANTSTRYFAKDSGSPGTSTETRTFSVYVKGLVRQWVSLCAANGSGGPYYRITVDLSNGTISSTDFDNDGTWFTTTPTHSISPAGPAGSGWYRVTITSRWCQYYLICPSDTASPSPASTNFGLGSAYVGDTNKGVILWGAQLELGSGASSYIPTGASQVTRNADQCSMTGSDFTNVFGDGSLGTIICSHEFPRADRGLAHQPTPWAIGNYVAANARGYSYANYAVGIGGYGWVYTSASFGSATTSAVSAAKNKCALSYNGLAITAALNGTTASSTGTGTITVSSATGLLIGYNATPRDFINACVSNIKFYPTALTAAQLQALTTP